MNTQFGPLSCPTSLRSPEPLYGVSAHSGDGQGQEIEVDLAVRDIWRDAGFLSVAPKALVRQNRDLIEEARERLNDALARIDA